MPKIVILRGNSGSGKSTVAGMLQAKLGRGTLLISQDYVRRELLYVRGGPDRNSIDLLQNLVLFGKEKCDFIILEGILYQDDHEHLFRQIKEWFEEDIFAYYFDLSFAETLERHKTKPVAAEFGEAEMKSWWREKDFIPFIDEKMIDESMSVGRIVDMIFSHLENDVAEAAT